VRFCFQYALDAGAWHAARRLHLELVRAVTHTSLAWHARVPVGRVVNRFSRDMNTIDWELRPILESLFGEIIAFFFRIFAVISVLPVFAVPCAVLCLVGAVVSETFSRTVVVLRRIESSAQSPVFSIFQDSMAGLEVIRGHAHGPRASSRELSAALQLASASRATNWLANRWLGVRIGLLVAIVLVCAGAIAIWKSATVATGLIGMALTNATAMSGTVFEIVLQLTSLELEMQKFERVEEYTVLPPEETPNEYDEDPSLAQWPESGKVEFKDVCVRYTPDGPDILHNVNLTLNAGERVAIVGRTGSGKSTLALTLLRFTYIASGKVVLSDRDITSLPRRTLRDSVALIPQEPVLLAGTVAWNLNPTGTVPKEALAAAVRSCSEVGTSSMDGWADADARVGPAGGNLSHGQRQVLALCRALARQSKLVVLDEATANMDYETDRGIQRVLRREVRGGGGRTLVTIAHRLRTIVDYDKVVVMGAGRVLE
jgi:ABC-type multidrug transport system fused ATPase/permease subunit